MRWRDSETREYLQENTEPGMRALLISILGIITLIDTQAVALI